MANTIKSGWASQTGFQYAETPLQRNITAKAKGEVGKRSGISISKPTGGWLTDTEGNDGICMRAAIEKYRNWAYLVSNKNNNAQIKSQMVADFARSGYDPDRKNKLVNRIVERCNLAIQRGPFLTPKDDNQTLIFLDIQKQCLEWAMTIANSAGGRYINYRIAPKNVALKAIRPGMGLYKSDSSHAMIIIDVYWDSGGNPVKFTVAESNWKAGPGGGWFNPKGAVPWERTVTTRTDVVLTGHYAVSYAP